MVFRFSILAALIRLVACAQDATTEQARSNVDPLRSGVIEAGVSAGLAAGDVGGATVNLPGVITYRVVGHSGPAGQLHVGFGIGLHYQFVAEAAYLSGGRAQQELAGGFHVESRAAAIAYSASMHFRFPTARHSPRFVPYLAGGFGTVQSRTDTLVVFTSPSTVPGQVITASTRVRLKEGSLAPIIGLGGQFYPTKKRVGLRVEANGYFPTGSSHTPYMLIAIGVITWLR